MAINSLYQTQNIAREQCRHEVHVNRPANQNITVQARVQVGAVTMDTHGLPEIRAWVQVQYIAQYQWTMIN